MKMRKMNAKIGAILISTAMVMSSMAAYAEEIVEPVEVVDEALTTAEVVEGDTTIVTETPLVETVVVNDAAPSAEVELESEEIIYDIDDDELVGATISSPIIAGCTLTENSIVYGDLVIKDGGSLNLNGFKLEVTGNVITNKSVDVGKGILVVNGDYIQKDGTLSQSAVSGRIEIKGNLRIQDIDAEDNYTKGSGSVSVGKSLSVGKNIYVDTSKSLTNTISNEGYLYVSGDIYDYSGSINGIHHWSSGDNYYLHTKLVGTQKHVIETLGSQTIGELLTENENVQVDIKGKLNTSWFGSGMTINVLGDSLEIDLGNFDAHKVTINGDVIATGDVNAKDGILVVNGNYMQKKGTLTNTTGRVDINGDLRLQTIDAENNYTTGEGIVKVGTAINVSKNFYLDSTGGIECALSRDGNISVKGNVYDISGRIFGEQNWTNGASYKLTWNFTGDGNQILQTPGARTIGKIKTTSGKLKIDGKLNISGLENDLEISLVKGDILKVGTVSLNGHNLTVIGNVIADGNIYNMSPKSTYKITGNYTQIANHLDPGSGLVSIGGDLILKGIDDNGSYTTGESYVDMSDEGGRLEVNGNFDMQTNSNTTLRSGTLTVNGNITQSSAGGATGYISSKVDHKTILPGKQKQVVSLENSKSQFGTLVLQSKDSQYAFNPNNCWIKLVHESENTKKFSDVRDNDWFKAAVDYAVQNGIMTGMGNDTFNPNGKCTREQMLQILFSAEGKVAVTVNNPFTDVKAGSWYYNAVLWGYSKGITGGLSATRFGVGQPVTREQMALFLMTYAKTKNFDTTARANISTFADAAKVSSWAREAISWANASKIISGKGGNRLDPTGTATRAEVAQMIMSFQKTFGK